MPRIIHQRTGTLLAASLALTIMGAWHAQAQMKGRFEEADADHDGRLTLQEFETYATQRLGTANGPMAQRFRQLGPQQQAVRLQQRFQQMDHGSKGYLDRADWSGS